MEENELWLKKLKERLGNYAEPVSDSGWKRLEKELVRFPASKRRLILRRRWAAAAAVALLLLSSSIALYDLFFVPVPHGVQEPDKAWSAYLPDEQPVVATPAAPAEVMPLAGRSALLADNTAKMPVVQASLHLPENSPAEEEERSQETHREEEMPAPVHKEENETANSDRSFYNSVIATVPERTSKRGKWSVALSVGNAGGATADAGGGAASYSMSRVSMLSLSNSLMEIPDGKTLVFDDGRVPYLREVSHVANIRHKQPVSAGVSIRRQLRKGFSIETGLTYTLLSSDIQLTGNTQTVEQKLHYLGIPLRANWDFFNNRYLTFYLSGGGMVEKCVYGKVGTEEENVKPVQLSVSGAVGAQLNVTKNVGIYAEPGVAYFFDDGSEVETIRKENPFNFNMQVGMRFTY